jgi:hypothetical protein
MKYIENIEMNIKLDKAKAQFAKEYFKWRYATKYMLWLMQCNLNKIYAKVYRFYRIKLIKSFSKL